MNQNLTGVMAFTANGQKFGHFTANKRFYPWRLKKINGLFFLRLAVEIFSILMLNRCTSKS